MFKWLRKLLRIGEEARKRKRGKKRILRPKLKPKIRLRRKKKIEEKVLLVSDLMTKNIIPVYSNQNLSEVAKLLIEKNISGAPVLDRNLFVGEISKTDILRIVNKNDLSELIKEDFEKLEKIMVYEIMKKPICILENETVEKAKKMMDKFKIRRLLVIDKKKRLIGIITRTDLLKGESKEKIKERVYTKIDEMVKMIEKESLDISTISKRLNVPENLVEEWAKILEESGLIEINYRAIGSPILKFKM
jgi:CBS domain-containing protein